MKFKTKYSKFGNQFFFISNLSEWSPYCRKEYNELWLKNKPLNKKEVEVLSDLKKILKKYKISNLMLSSSNKKWAIKKVSKIIPKKDVLVLTNSLKIFYKRFSVLWKKEENNLILIKQQIEKALSILSISNKLFPIIKILYGIRKEPGKVEIFLFTSPIFKRSVSGGGSFGKNKIGIECSKITKNNNQNQMLQRVVIHEIIHASFEVNLKEKIKKFIESLYFKKKYEKLILKSRVYRQTHSIMGTAKEMILVSLIPEGYLAEKFFNLDVLKNLRERKCIKEGMLKKNYYDLMLYSIFKLYQTAKKYCENKMQINENYIEDAIKCWIAFEKSNLKNFEI